MNIETIVVRSYFCGERHHDDGPYAIRLCDDLIESVEKVNVPVVDHEFLMPGMVEGHCHIFLKGEELDPAERSAYLKRKDRDEMLEVARENMRKNLAAGVTLLRDAGDANGINTSIRAESAVTEEIWPQIRTAAVALRKRKRYGGFMAREAVGLDDIPSTVSSLAVEADELKVLMTGIIDFENGVVKGKPQFTSEEACLITQVARRLGKRTFAHCSGTDGLEICVEAGMDSIEHGFFMTENILARMATKGLAWVPTYAPVHFHYQFPGHCKWSPETVVRLGEILENHRRHMVVADQIGVSIVAGSDAGSYGVEHGAGLIDEICTMVECGISTARAIAAATSVPRSLWGVASNSIAKGNQADFVLLESSPFDDIQSLRKAVAVRTPIGWNDCLLAP